MRKVFHIFFHAEGARPFLVLFALLVAALCEAIGISALLPAVAIVADQPGGAASGSHSGLSQKVLDALDWVGIAPTLGNLVLIIGVALVLKSVVGFFALTYAANSAARVGVRLRERLLDALFGASWRFYSEQQSGSFASAISADAARAAEAYLMAANFCAMAVQAAIYVIITLFIDWRLALLGLAVGLVISHSMGFLIRMSKKAGRRGVNATRDLTVKTVELLGNIKPLKTMHRYDSFRTSIRKAMMKLEKAQRQRGVAQQLTVQSGDAVMAIALCLVIYISYTYFHVTITALLVGGILFMKVLDNFGRLQRMLQQSAQTEASYDRLEQLIALTEANREPARGTLAPDAAGDCRFEHVSFSYGGHDVLQDVNILMPARKVTVLKGLSGSGKTTLVDLLIGLHRPRSGRITVGGAPLEEIDIVKLRRRIGYVSQELSLLHAPLRENICLGDESLTEDDIAQAVRLAGLEGFIASLPQGLDTSAGEMGARLSGGQRQRIALARALVTRPGILILDEVTSALDPTTEAEIVNNIRSLAHEFTIIVITHRDAWVDVADRLYEVRAGRVNEVGRAAAYSMIR
ncbi:ABC transporter ATP-binding protein [Aestuariivirga sp.]|uniref:ABC transporter ATP-binding protein n=1 Tax=Aestuariivirga sp. TaxID=2650926 RepID=UPI0025C0206D|nr:ABC transporter ATP-binding protein [Aestuariivirga sp.]MCA3555872.1 ABC transporter ATP-binding protein [Aestuariivirga sp.]